MKNHTTERTTDDRTSDVLSRFISQADKSSVRAPIGQAQTLPGEAFVSAEYFDLEIQRIFGRNWMALCFSNVIPEAGDVLPRTLFGMPLLVMRDWNRQVHVFHNVCPYDGCPVELSARSGVRELTVPYHGWCYDLNGKLLRTPYWNGVSSSDLYRPEGREYDLVELSSAESLGLIFIRFGEGDISLDDFLHPLTSVLANISIDDLVAVEDNRALLLDGREVSANWKTYLENAAINILHESFTHDSYRQSPEIPRVKNGKRSYFLHMDGPLIGFGFEWGDLTQTYPGLPFVHIGAERGKPPECGYFLTMFPNVVVVIMPTLMRMNICIPLNPGETRIFHCGYYHADSLTEPEFRSGHDEICRLFHKAYDEDRVIIEAVQLARRSPVWRRHFYSSFWDEPHYRLNNIILDNMEL